MDLLVSRVFDMPDSFASPLESLTTPSADAFHLRFISTRMEIYWGPLNVMLMYTS